MNGTLVMAAFGYSFVDGTIAVGQGAPTKTRFLRFVDESGATIDMAFVGREQWEEFQRQVAEAEFPPLVDVAPAAALDALRNGH